MNVFEAEILWRTETKLRKTLSSREPPLQAIIQILLSSDRNLHTPTRCLIDRSEYVGKNGDSYHEWIKFIRPSLTSSRHFSDSLDSSFQFSRIVTTELTEIFFLRRDDVKLWPCVHRSCIFIFFLPLLSKKKLVIIFDWIFLIYLYSVDWNRNSFGKIEGRGVNEG